MENMILVVTKIHPGSQAETLDIRIGDALLSYNGQRLGSNADFVAAIVNARRAKTAAIEVVPLLSHFAEEDSPISWAFLIQLIHHKPLNQKAKSGYGLSSYRTWAAPENRPAT